MTDDNPNPIYFVTDENGSPLGLFDAQQITDEGHRFAFELAAVCDDPEALKRVQAETLQRVGSSSFGYVSANALTLMAEVILNGAFEVCRAHGTDLQAGMRDLGEGRLPQ